MQNSVKFNELSLPVSLLNALEQLGHHTPTPIQVQAIPALLEGQDLLGQAQTGTGKTGAFALPLLAKIDLQQKHPQVLVLAPTRELAIQVTEAFQDYAAQMKGFYSLSVYGGQSYSDQLKALKRGVQVVVGTPGRVLDHIKRGSLKLDQLQAAVLDEADEMLRMGFIEDVQEILEHAPENCQMAMFSATMPAPIRKIANKNLKDPVEIQIASKTTTVEKIQQSFILLKNNQKMDALKRILEVETYDGVIIFTKTKITTVKVAEELMSQGLSVSALNGDMNQMNRERTILQLKEGKIDIVVATDVAARGLDVERISLVINYDIPQDTEPYVHRIGRTGRAGREGKAILFVTQQEKRMLKTIEATTKQSLTQEEIPSNQQLEKKRLQRFKDKLIGKLSDYKLHELSETMKELQKELQINQNELTLALLAVLQETQPLKLPVISNTPVTKPHKQRLEKSFSKDKSTRRTKSVKSKSPKGVKFDAYRLEVGKRHKVRVADIVGAIANEADIESRNIGNIKLFDDHSIVELPEGMPKAVFKHLKRVSIRQRPLNLSLVAQ